MREESLLELVPAAPVDRFDYGKADVPDLAAIYADAPTSNHPFVDGNKRTAF